MDDFYRPVKNTLKNITAILHWAHENSNQTDIHYLNCIESFSRQVSDKSFQEVMGHISKESKGYFRIIYRRDWNAWGICSDSSTPMDFLEIGISGIRINGIEHFVFIYLDKDKLVELMELFEIEPVH